MSDRIGRREFLRQGSIAGVAATAALPAALPLAPAAAAAPLHPLPAEDPRLAERQLDSRAYSLARYERIRPALGFSATDPAEARAWQARARPKLAELVGGFPARVELRPEVLERKRFDGYTRERVVFQTRDDLSAIGYLLLPEGATGPLPAILCLPGHGRGADDDVGIEPPGAEPEELGGYARDFPVQAVRRGYAVFALEQLGFGARRDEAARKSGPRASSCRPAAGAALLFGESMIGWRVWDAMRTLDYLATRPEIDAGRLATMGISGGGTISLFTAALDERVKAAVVSGYFNTFRDCIVTLSHCMDNYVPGLLKEMEMYDLAGLVAPRGLFTESGSEDRIFPIEGFRTAVEQGARIYGAFGVPDRFGHEIHGGGHEFHGAGAFRFLQTALG